MLTIGPITIMSTKTRKAYRVLTNRAYALHQTIWFTDDLGNPSAQEKIKKLDSEVSDAISRVPASDVDAPATN